MLRLTLWKPRLVELRVQAVFVWFERYASRLSLARIIFLAFMFVQIACLTPVYVVIYQQYLGTIDKKHALLNRQSEKDIRVQVDLYQDILSYISRNNITPRIELIFKDFQKAIQGPSEMIDAKLAALKAKYRIDFILIDKAQNQIVNTTREDYFGKKFSKWPHMVDFMDTMPSDKIVSRTSWSVSSSRLKHFYFLKPSAGNYILEISWYLPDDLNLNLVVNYLANITYHNPFIKRVYFYDSKNYRLHNSRHRPSAKLVGNLARLFSSQSSVLIQEDLEAGVVQKFIRLPARSAGANFRNIVAFEIQYDQHRINSEKMYLRGYFIALLLVMLMIAYILSRFLSRIFTNPITQLVSQIEELSTVSLDRRLDPIRQREFTTLVDSVNLLADALKANIKKAQVLSRKIINTQDEERKRIAQDLHDSVGQSLVAVKMKLSLSPSGSDKYISESKELLNFCSSELRNIYNSMYPSILRDLGLGEAIYWYANTLFGNDVETAIEIDSDLKVTSQQAMHMFRVVQEALGNCKKHAKASFVGLYLTQKEGQVFLKIADNGQGISKESTGESRFLSGLGVQSIKLRVEEMNGEFSIKNGKLGGVEISITIPGRETEEI